MQEESQARLQGLNMPEEDDDQTELIQELSQSDLLQQTDDRALQNFLSKDIPTSNFSEEELAEFRAEVDIVLMKKRARYPHENQDVTGVLREWVHDDPSAGLNPQDKGDFLADQTLGQTIKARINKGKDGSLVRTVLSSIKHSIVDRGTGGDSGGRLLSRIRN